MCFQSLPGEAATFDTESTGNGKQTGGQNIWGPTQTSKCRNLISMQTERKIKQI